MGASRLVDDSLISVAGGTGYRGQLGDVEEAVYRPPLSPCGSSAFHHPGFCGSAHPGYLASAHPRDGDRTPAPRWCAAPDSLLRGAPPPGYPAADLFGDALMLQFTPQSRIFV